VQRDDRAILVHKREDGNDGRDCSGDCNIKDEKRKKKVNLTWEDKAAMRCMNSRRA